MLVFFTIISYVRIDSIRVAAAWPDSRANACPGAFVPGVPTPRKAGNVGCFSSMSRAAYDAARKNIGMYVGGVCLCFLGGGSGRAEAIRAVIRVRVGMVAPVSP